MNVRRGAESVNSRTRSELQRLSSAGDVLFRCPAERCDCNVPALSRDSPDRCKVAFGRDRKPGFNDVNAKALELLRHPDLFVEIHRAAGRLFAVAQGRVEDADSGL